jgi:hypothetical protein
MQPVVAKAHLGRAAPHSGYGVGGAILWLKTQKDPGICAGVEFCQYLEISG